MKYMAYLDSAAYCKSYFWLIMDICWVHLEHILDLSETHMDKFCAFIWYILAMY